MNGTVKWFNRVKGFGFISGEDGSDYFVHYTSVPKGVFLRENDAVTFEAVETEKGKQAQNVALGGTGVPINETPAAEEAPMEESVEEAPAEEPETEEQPKEPKAEETVEEPAPEKKPAEE